MNVKTLLAGTATALALTAAAATPANAVITTFANFSALTTDNFYYKAASGAGFGSYYSIATPTSTTPGSVDVDFSFINEGSLLDSAVTNVTALFTLTGSSTGPTTTAAGFLIEPVSGTFTLKSTTSITVGTTTYAAGSTLLSGAYTEADIVGKASTTNGNLDGDNVVDPTATPPIADTLTYASDFVTFQPNAALGLGFTLTSIIPALAQTHVGSNSLKTFKTDAIASFSADPVPHVNAGVPEPASWALMMLGFGLAGASLRRRAQAQAAV